MSSTYTTNTSLNKPGTNDTGWDTPIRANLDQIDALGAVGPLAVTYTENPSASLNVKVAAGSYRKSDGTVVSYAGTASQAMTASQTNYVYLTDAGTLTVNTTGFPASSNIVPLATVVAGTSTITSIADSRRPFASYGASALAITADTDTATITFDCSGGAAVSKHSVTLGGNRTLAVSGDADGQEIDIILTQDATGSRTVTFWSGIKWAGGSAPTLTTTAGKADRVKILRTGSGAYLGAVVGQNY